MFNTKTIISLLCIVTLSLLGDAKRSRSIVHVTGSSTASDYTDLSYSFNEDTIYFPGQTEFTLNKDYDGVNKSGIWYSAFSFCMGEHGGTHLDAPFHFNKDGWTLDKIPASYLIDIRAVIIDVESRVKNHPVPAEYLLDVDQILSYESLYGEISDGSVVLVHTGWSKFWPEKIRYLGLKNDTTTPNFPGISEQAARFLVNERQILGIGIDTPSVDIGSSQAFPVHVFLAKRNIYNLENVANLHIMLKTTVSNPHCSLHLFILPIKIIGATGSPTRILAYCK